jgi:hypothetical protein
VKAWRRHLHKYDDDAAAAGAASPTTTTTLPTKVNSKVHRSTVLVAALASSSPSNAQSKWMKLL